VGVGEMICAIASERISEEDMNRLLDRVVSEVRRNREKSFTLIIIASSARKVFMYRDSFTKYIDVGVRLYFDDSIQKLAEVLNSCAKLFCSAGDQGLKNTSLNKALCI
jgi:hypothetical protein